MPKIINYTYLIYLLMMADVNAEVLRLYLGNTNEEIESAKIIKNRLNQARSFFEPEIELIQEHKKVYLLVDEKITNSDYFLFLKNRQGKLEAFTESNFKKVVWFAEKDIKNAGSKNGSLDFQVAEEAARKIDCMFKEKKGQILTILLDNRVILKAKLNKPLGKYFRIKSSLISNAEYIAILLKYGSLKKITEVRQ